VKALQGGNQILKDRRAVDLSQRRKLPVGLSAQDCQLDRSIEWLWNGDQNDLIGKEYTRFIVCLELGCATDELSQLW
jgi:hypothetical protein